MDFSYTRLSQSPLSLECKIFKIPHDALECALKLSLRVFMVRGAVHRSSQNQNFLFRFHLIGNYVESATYQIKLTTAGKFHIFREILY